MGLNASAVKILMEEALRRPFAGRLLSFGRQDIFITCDTLKELASAMKFPLDMSAPVTLSHKKDFADNGYISDTSLYKLLGFTEAVSSDASDYEDAAHVVDLNYTNIPESFVEGFDVILDGGTIEHVFHVPNVFLNIFRILRPGGRVIHFAPSSNHIDHGFYMFSPTLFWDFYHANAFEVNRCHLFMYTLNLYGGQWEVYDYRPGRLDHVSLGGLDDNLYGVICIATKTERSTGDVIPQQGKYADEVGLWKTNDPAALEAAATGAPPATGAPRPNISIRVLRRIFRRILPPDKKNIGLRIIDRY